MEAQITTSEQFNSLSYDTELLPVQGR